MIGVSAADFLAQFVALGASILTLFGLSKIPFIKTLWKRNVTEPYRTWLHDIVEPVRADIARVEDKVSDVAAFVGYQFSPNGGNSMRDRVDLIVRNTEGDQDGVDGSRTD